MCCNFLMKGTNLYNLIVDSNKLESYWNNFKKSHVYASSISYKQVMDKIKMIVDVTMDKIYN